MSGAVVGGSGSGLKIGASIAKTTTQAIAHSTTTILTAFDSTTHNDGCTVDLANGKITVLDTGTWLLVGQIVFAPSNTAGGRRADLFKNGTLLGNNCFVGNAQTNPAGGTPSTAPLISLIIKLTANDYIQVGGLQDSNSSINSTTAALQCQLLARG